MKTKVKIGIVLDYFRDAKTENETKIYIGDVLEYPPQKLSMLLDTELPRLYKLWMNAGLNEKKNHLGFKKSLNEIFEEKIIPAQEADCSNCLKNCSRCKKEVFENPHIQYLLEFLYQLIKEK